MSKKHVVVEPYNIAWKQDLKVPLLKEVKTYIAVAKALTIYKIDKGGI